MNIEDIITKLKTISTIEKGQTFSPSYDLPLDHNIWSTTISRTYYREDRKKSIMYIKEILNHGYQFYIKDHNIELRKLLFCALNGLDNLKVTYKGDFMMLGLINTILDDYDNKLNTAYKSEFLMAVKSNNYDYVENYLYEANEANEANLKNEDLQNALHIISDKKYYNSKIMDVLLNFNIHITDKDIHGNTPLYYAITSGCTDAVLKLEEAIAKK